MWAFYMISLPLTVGMVGVTLRYFAGPAVPLYVLATVGYAWLCSLSIIILVPSDISTVRSLLLLSSSHHRLSRASFAALCLTCAVQLIGDDHLGVRRKLGCLPVYGLGFNWESGKCHGIRD